MRSTDMEALGGVAAEGLTVLNSVVRGMHKGIAGRVFSSIGPAAKPVEVVHNTISRAVYDGLDLAGHRLPPAISSLAAATTAFDDDAPLDEHPRAAELIAALNGIYGDELTNRGNGFALTMQVRHRGRPVAMSAPDIAAAFPQATGRIAVFLHGWCMTEMSWWRRPRDGEEVKSYGARLRDDLGFTPVYLRYNTGLHISDNGKSLAALLEQLRALWPVPVEDIVLIGHSMGGLVIRSACHYGTQHEHAWPDAVRHIVCLGSPHLGADLEKGVNAASWALARLPETRALSSFLNARSSGTKDLRYGALLDEDWSECDPDEFLRDRCNEVPFLPHAVYHFVATSAAPGAVGAVLGDRLVRPQSASGVGKSRRIPFDPDHGLTLTGLHHFDLLNHADIYAKLHDWLAQPPRPDTPR
jgi:pimeloyl-ACP methyl ester carboxylesterase